MDSIWSRNGVPSVAYAIYFAFAFVAARFLLNVFIYQEKRQSHDNPPQKCESQNNPIIKDVEIMASEGDVNLGFNSGVANYYENQQSHNTYTQTGGGINNPQIQGVGKISNKGNFNMGSYSGWTNNFNNQGNKASKQIQGVNDSTITM